MTWKAYIPVPGVAITDLKQEAASQAVISSAAVKRPLFLIIQPGLFPAAYRFAPLVTCPPAFTALMKQHNDSLR